MTSGEHTKGADLPAKIWAERVGIGADDIALLASSLPIRSTLYYRADFVAELVNALEGMIGTASVACDVIDDGTHRIDCTKKEWDAHVSATKAACAALTRFREAQAGGGE